MKFYSFTNRFVILLVVLALLLPGVVMAQTDEPLPIETITFETNTPQPTTTEVVVTDEVTPIPAVTEVVATPIVDPPVEPEPPAPPESGISEATLLAVVQTLVWGVIALVTAIVVITIAYGLLQGKSVHELARSQPVQWGITAAANAAALTPDDTDDKWIEERAKQLGWKVTRESGVITLKKIDTPPISPASG